MFMNVYTSTVNCYIILLIILKFPTGSIATYIMYTYKCIFQDQYISFSNYFDDIFNFMKQFSR